MNYIIASGKDTGCGDGSLPGSFHQYIILGRFSSLEEAKNSRVIAADLIFDKEGNIVKDFSWLWEWEREDVKSYAHSSILNGKKLPSHSPMR